MLLYNGKLKQYSRKLRSCMTDAERRLWSKLRMRQLNNAQFYRQKPIGNYIADFYCPEAKLVIEVDGGQHFTDEVRRYDEERDRCLCSLGLRVLRFSDTEVLKNIEGVVQVIVENLEV